MWFLGCIAMGAIAGWLAGQFMRGYGFGLVGDVIVGSGLLGSLTVSSGDRTWGSDDNGVMDQRRLPCGVRAQDT